MDELQLPDLTSLIKSTLTTGADPGPTGPTMADPGPTGPTIDDPGPPTATAVKEKQMLLLILAAYADKFPADLAFIEAELTSDALIGQTLGELRALRDRCDMAVGINMASENKRQIFNTCIYALENFTTSMGFNTTGATARLISNKDFQKNLTRLSLKWLSEKETSAEYAVLGCMITTFAQSYMVNDQTATDPTVPTTATGHTPLQTQPPSGQPAAHDEYHDLDNIGDINK